MQYLIPEAHNEQNSSSRPMGTNQQFNVNQKKKRKKKREAFLYRRKLLKSISHDGMAKPGVWETRTNDLH